MSLTQTEKKELLEKMQAAGRELANAAAQQIDYKGLRKLAHDARAGLSNQESKFFRSSLQGKIVEHARDKNASLETRVVNTRIRRGLASIAKLSAH